MSTIPELVVLRSDDEQDFVKREKAIDDEKKKLEETIAAKEAKLEAAPQMERVQLQQQITALHQRLISVQQERASVQAERTSVQEGRTALLKMQAGAAGTHHF
jgi:uncharacterized protein YlxW (UPF0749 family)